MRNFATIYNKYQDRDYFGQEARIRRKCLELDKMHERGQAMHLTQADVCNHYNFHDRALTWEWFRMLELAVDSNCLGKLADRIKYDQRMTLEFLEILTGDKWLGLNNSQIAEMIKELSNE